MIVSIRNGHKMILPVCCQDNVCLKRSTGMAQSGSSTQILSSFPSTVPSQRRSWETDSSSLWPESWVVISLVNGRAGTSATFPLSDDAERWWNFGYVASEILCVCFLNENSVVRTEGCVRTRWHEPRWVATWGVSTATEPSPRSYFSASFYNYFH